jgi:hypothetical protein
VNLIVPVRFVPLAAVPFVNLTPTVQVAPGANVAPVQLSAPMTLLNRKPVPGPFWTVTLLTVICAALVPVAVFVSVTVPVPVFTPVGSVMVSGLGVIVTVAPLATPVPVRVTGEPVTVAPV